MNAMATKLEDANGTVIANKAISYDAGNTSLVLLIANNVDNAVSFKDLNIQTLNTPIQTPESSPKPIIIHDEITFSIIITLLLAGTLAVAAAFYVKKTKLLKRKD
jgi:hypothetical protein